MTNYMEYASLFEAGGMLALAVIILVAFRHLRGLRENLYGGTGALRARSQSWARRVYAKKG
jgi:hypothetical protein